jgi:hypothetical protein
VVRDYNRHCRLAIESPRPKDVEKELLGLRDAFDNLANKIAALSTETLPYISGDVLAQSSHSELGRAARIDLLPCWSAPGVEPNPDSYLVLSRNATKYLDLAIDRYRGRLKSKRRSGDDRSGVDRGGRGNLFRQKYSHETLVLVKGCIDIWIEFLGAKPSTTVDGRFYSFVSAVMDYATGADGSAVGLADHIKKGIREIPAIATAPRQRGKSTMSSRRVAKVMTRSE